MVWLAMQCEMIVEERQDAMAAILGFHEMEDVITCALKCVH